MANCASDAEIDNSSLAMNRRKTLGFFNLTANVP